MRALGRIVEENFPLLIRRLLVGRSSLADRQKPDRIDAGDDRLSGFTWLSDCQRFDQRLRARKIERHDGVFAGASGPGESQMASPAFEANFASLLIAREVNRRFG